MIISSCCGIKTYDYGRCENWDGLNGGHRGTVGRLVSPTHCDLPRRPQASFKCVVARSPRDCLRDKLWGIVVELWLTEE